MPETKDLRKRLENVTLDGKPVFEVVQEQAATEIEKVAKREISEKKIGINPPIVTKQKTNISGARTERKDFTQVFSAELIADANFRFLQGEETMATLPNQLPFEDVKKGNIELALDDARKKARFYKSEAIKNEQEAIKWEAVASQLEGALGMVTGKVTIGSVDQPQKERRARGPNINWVATFHEIFANGKLTYDEMMSALLAKFPQKNRHDFYMSISKYKGDGTIIQSADKQFYEVKG